MNFFTQSWPWLRAEARMGWRPCRPVGRVKFPILGEPLKVPILAGQPDMQWQADVRTLAGITMNPEAHPLYEKLLDEDGRPRVFDNVWFAAFSQRGGSGEVVEKHGKLTVGAGRIGETFGKAPIALEWTFANSSPLPMGEGPGVRA